MREFHRIIAEQAAHMRGLIRDVLDAGRIDSGSLLVTRRARGGDGPGGAGAKHVPEGGDRHAVLVDLPAELPTVMADGRRIVQTAYRSGDPAEPEDRNLDERCIHSRPR